MRMQWVIDLSLMLALVETALAVIGHETGRKCPETFNFLHESYSSCAPYNRNNAAQQKKQQTTITGEDIIIQFQEVCSSRLRMEKCRALALEGCSRSHLENYQAAVNKSLWFCDDQSKIHGAVTQALTGTALIPDTEKKTANCLKESDMYSCVGKILAQKKFSRVKDYGNIVQHHAYQVLNDPFTHTYFKELFDCYFDVVHARCPHNTIPMTIYSQKHMFSPPKFGVNISDIILNKFSNFHSK